MKNIKQQKLCFFMVLLQYAFAAVLYFFYSKNSGKQSVEFLLQCTNVLLIGGTLSLLSWRHSVLSWKAFLEKRNNEENPVEDNIFNNEEAMYGRMERAFYQFNKIMLPVILVVISFGEVFLSGRILAFEEIKIENPEGDLLVISAVMTALAIVLFLSGKFMAGLAYGEKYHFLRPISGYLLLNAITLFLGVVCSLAYYFGAEGILDVFLLGSIILSVALAIERLFLWVMDLYRPKNKNDQYIPVYESRILALFSQPRGVFGNLASMLEYQFGMKISESTFSTFFKRVVIPFLGLQALSLFMLSCITYIRPYEKGLKFSWDQTNFTVLEPGLYLSAPWPLCKVERFDVMRVKEVNLTESEEFIKDFKPRFVDTWQNESYKNLMNMVALKSNGQSGHGLVVANVKLKYSILDVMKFRAAYVDGESALKMYGQQILSRALLENDYNVILKRGFQKFSDQLHRDLQEKIGNELGVDIVSVNIINFQPPPELDLKPGGTPSVQAIFEARQDGIRQMTESEKYSIEKVSAKISEADEIIKLAKSETIRRSLLLDAEADSFEAQLKAYRKLPLFYETQAKMISFERWIKDVRKIVNLTDSNEEVITLELKKIAPDLLNME